MKIRKYDMRFGAYQSSDPIGTVSELVGSGLNPAFAARDDAAIHPLNNLTTDVIVEDLLVLTKGRGGAVRSQFVRDHVRAQGLDPDALPVLPRQNALKMHDDIVLLLRRRVRHRDESQLVATLAKGLILAPDEEKCQLAGGTIATAAVIRRVLTEKLGYTVSEFYELSKDEQNKVYRRLERRVRAEDPTTSPEHREMLKTEVKKRTDFHLWLCGWAERPLVLERPSASWLRHLLDYDASIMGGEVSSLAKSVDNGDLQHVVVENDWGAAVPPSEGEWHLPFRETSWEFHVSGVRVIAVFGESDKHPGDMWMFLMYGRGGTWVSDDFTYSISGGAMSRDPYDGNKTPLDLREFRRVNEYCLRAVRSACIMMDAEVAERVRVKGSGARSSIVAHGVVKGMARPLRDHYVVRLLSRRGKSQERVARSAGAGVSGPRSPQRGHWRQGTWVHYDDPDSGQVQYANDGGFIVSKTWRRWHFAGDPNNILHKEYRI